MPDYRLYRLNELNRIIQAVEYSGVDDDAAVAEAIRIDHAAVVEIWCGWRLVSRVDPANPRDIHPRSQPSTSPSPT